MARANTALAPRSGASGVLLHGMPGGGKTACALELAYAHEHAFETLIWYKAPDRGRDIDAALTGFALALEHALHGVPLVRLLDDEVGLAGFWPDLTELCERCRVLFVIDNADSLLTDRGQWRDRRWAEAVAAITGHSGLSRLLLTSRVRPAGLDPRVRAEQVDALSLAESVLLARELPRLRALVEGQAARMTVADSRMLVRQVLEYAQGHPKLLELADGRAGDPAALRAALDATGDAWRARGGLPEGFFAIGESPASGDDYRHVLTAWTQLATAQLPGGAREAFMLLCCLEEADRVSPVVDSTWPRVRRRLGRQGRMPGTGSMRELRQQGLIAVHNGRDGTAAAYGIHPAIVEAGRAAAGEGFQAAVDAEVSGYWAATSRAATQAETIAGTGTDVVEAGLRAVPYLLRHGQPDSALALLEEVLARDHSRATATAALPWLGEIAQALRGQPNESAAAGTLARVLRTVSPIAAEQQLISVLADAVDRIAYHTAFVAAADLSDLLRESGRLDEALTYAEQSIGFAARAQLGPWTRITAERERLLIMLEQGRADQVLGEVRRLAEQVAALPAIPGDNDAVMPWMTQEFLLDTGRAAALRLERWSEALEYNADHIGAMRRRGAPSDEIMRARFSDYGPLLSLGRADEALALLQECRDAAERDQDTEMLGVIFGALAEAEDARGHPQVAAEQCKVALRYMYAAGMPADIAGGHARLGNYLGRGGRSHPEAVTQFLAAALLWTLTGIEQADRPIAAAAAHVRAAQSGGIIPRDVTDLHRRTEEMPGISFRALIARISTDRNAGRAYDEIIRQVRALAAQPRDVSRDAPRVQWDPPIAALQAAKQGNEAAAEMAGRFLDVLETQVGRPALAGVLRRILAGERDANGLTNGLDDRDAVVAQRTLDALAGRIEVPDALWRATPIAGALVDLVAACRRVPAAPARARRNLTAMASHPEWSDLAPVLEWILAGERGNQLLDGLTNPTHRAVVTLVLTEINA